ncbi:Glycosyl transferases group 1 [Dyadobacter sp. SG02]|uniref:glycosyltransferase family 4 protein n=1 Tax=Dyadobacter sp. SG02 TaxID=1855291 RepID=UPI0008BB2641|nr:glycosyltransferase [Dyadobacter sp. SG02]SEJ39127.1 Glycosyl transferases group 1 [Dyadobacter sp. SG02]
MKALLSHPTGNANVRAIANELARTRKLQGFYTTIASFQGTKTDTASRLPGLGDLKRRSFDPALRAHTHTHPWFELARIFAGKTRMRSLTAHESGFFSIDKVYQEMDRYVARQLPGLIKTDLDVVYAYEDGALETFSQARKLGITCVYELPIAFWKTGRRLLEEEAIRLPEWSGTLAGGISDSGQKLERKSMELELADVVVTPGSFVADSLNGMITGKKLIVSPFGSPPCHFLNQKSTRPGRALRVLFAGTLSQRKGLADLLQAIKILNTNKIELVIMGSLVLDLSFYRKQHPGFTYEPTRPHADVLRLMRTCDVLCLPSIVEGRALVIQEAMTQGLPVIITANTGGKDLIIEGKTGFEVPIRCPEAIADRLHWFLDHRNRLEEMGEHAQRHAASYSWTVYAHNIITGIEETLANKS